MSSFLLPNAVNQHNPHGEVKKIQNYLNADQFQNAAECFHVSFYCKWYSYILLSSNGRYAWQK